MDSQNANKNCQAVIYPEILVIGQQVCGRCLLNSQIANFILHFVWQLTFRDANNDLEHYSEDGLNHKNFLTGPIFLLFTAPRPKIGEHEIHFGHEVGNH